MKHTFSKITFLALLLSGLSSGRLFAQLSSAVPFLQIEPDARMSGMGNAGSAIADNASAIFWNPAGLAERKGTEVSFTHSNWLPAFNAELYFEYLVAKHHVEGIGTFGGHITFLNMGEHERRNAQNELEGTFRSYDASAGLSYATQLNKNLSVGTGIRLIYSNLDSGGGSVGTQQTQAGISAGFDLAAKYKSNPISMGKAKATVSAGLNLANMGPTIQYSDSGQADPIPTNIRLGLATKFDIDEYNSFTLVADANKLLIHSEKDATTGNYTPDPFYKAIFTSWQPLTVNTAAQGQEPVYKELSAINQMTFAVGMEYWYRNFVAFRGGYFYENPNNGNRNFLTAGLGVRHSIIGVDVSYIIALREQDPLANTPRFSILLNL